MQTYLGALENLKNTSLQLTIVSLLYFLGFFYPVLLIVAFFLFVGVREGFLRVFQDFASLGRNTNMGISGVTLLLVGLLIGLFAGLTFYLAKSIGGPLLTTAAIVILMAQILIGVALYMIGKDATDALIKAAGVVQIVIPFLGWILAYLWANEEISAIRTDKISAQATTQEISQQPKTQQLTEEALVHQVGIGYLKPNGEAKIKLNSKSGGIAILSATLEGFNISTANVSPFMLESGDNEITIMFPTTPGLASGKTYVVVLSFSNGQSVKASVEYREAV